MSLPLTMTATAPPLNLPPLFDARFAATAEAVEPTARRLSEDGAEAGTLVISPELHHLRCACVLHPEEPLNGARRALFVAMNGLADGLGAILPPHIAVTFRWPNTLLLNGGRAGAFGLIHPAGMSEAAVPAWLVVGFDLVIQSHDGAEPGTDREATGLAAEGADDLGALAVMEAYARHLLSNFDRYEAEGFAPVRRDWLARAEHYRAETTLPGPNGPASGTFTGLSETGDALLRHKFGLATLRLADALDVTAP